MLTTVCHIFLFIIFVILPIVGLWWIFASSSKKDKAKRLADEQIAETEKK